MASINTARPDADPPRPTNGAGSPRAAAAVVAPVPAPPGDGRAALAPFRAGRGEGDRTADLLAYAIAAERGLPPTPDGVSRARQEADAALGDHAIRYLHNNVEQIRQEAVAAHLGRLRQPPGFVRLVLANLVALAAAGGLAVWAWTRPEVRTAVAGLLGS